MVNKLWYLAICMQDSHHGTWHYVITVWRHLIFWWIWVPGFQTKILWKLIWSVVFKFKRYFIDYNIAYNIYHTWYMVKRVSVSVVRKEESGFFAPQLHHNAPQFTTHSSRQNKKYYSPLSLGRGRAEGWGHQHCSELSKFFVNCILGPGPSALSQRPHSAGPSSVTLRSQDTDTRTI